MIYMIAAIGLIVLDARQSAYLRPVHNFLGVINQPLQYLVDEPVRFSRYIITSLSRNQTLIEDNTNLQAKNLLLEAKLQKFLAIEKENKELRELLSSSPQPDERLLVAQIVAVQTESYLNQLMIDKGSQDGVFVNQAVLDAKGIVGQVIEVNLTTSRVMLITDTRNAVPVQIVRNGMHAIALGNGAVGTLSLAHIPITADIKEGDVLVSSGIGQRYPAGYPVGVIKRIDREASNDFAATVVEPAARLRHNSLVLLVWPPNPANPEAKHLTEKKHSAEKKHHANK